MKPRDAFELLTFSGGVVSFSGAVSTNSEYGDIFKQISQMTLQAKNQGRNRVIMQTMAKRAL